MVYRYQDWHLLDLTTMLRRGGAERVLELIEQRLTVGLQLHIIQLPDANCRFIGSERHQGQGRVERLVPKPRAAPSAPCVPLV